MEQERRVTQFQQDKPPACVPCSPKRAQGAAWLCHPNATLAFISQPGWSLLAFLSLSWSLCFPWPWLQARPVCRVLWGAEPSCQGLRARGQRGCQGAALADPAPRTRQGSLGSGPFGCPALVRHLQPCAHTRFPALALPCQ